MRAAPGRPCTVVGCKALQPCATHPRKPWATAIRSTTLYRTARWYRESREHLDREPYCRECKAEGKLIVATVVDHIRPHRGDIAAFWNRTNWQSLCRRHHNAKTGRETRERAKTWA